MKRRSKELGEMLSRALGARSEQWLADQVNVSQARISQYLSGHIPPAIRLSYLAAALQLDFHTLRKVAGYESSDFLISAQESYVGQASLVDLLSSHHKHIQAISAMWEGGMPEMAIVAAVSVDNTLQSQIKRYADTKYHVELLYLRSRLLCELGCAYTVSLSAEDALNPIKSVASQQFTIARQMAESGLDDAIPMAFGHRSLGDAYYALRNCPEAERNYSDAFAYEKDGHRRIELLRGLALTAAYKERPREYEQFDRQIKKCFDSDPGLDARTAATLLEAEGRALALFSDPLAWTTLYAATASMEKVDLEGDPFVCRRLQLLRTRIVAKLYLEGLDLDEDDLIENIKNAIALARLHKYLKYVEEIRKLLIEFGTRHPDFPFIATLIQMFFPQIATPGTRFSH